jgi:hypothetical protein
MAGGPSTTARVTARLGLYAATAALASFLLFSMELMVGRLLLPRLGGSPGAWNTALVFFQVALLAGYAWAGAGRRIGPRAHRLAQVALAVAVVALLPLGLPAAWEPDPGAPTRSTLAVLALHIGLPFVALATTSPLLQVWSTSWLPAGREPYHLFAAGNLGSLAALVAYPVVVEPSLGLRAQARWWTVGYTVFLVLLAACAAFARLDRGSRPAGLRPIGTPHSPTSWRERVTWAALAAVPSALLLAVTRHLTVDVAPVALLWVLPLAVYLASFVVAFARRRPRWVRPVAAAASVVGAVAVAVSISGTPRLVGQLMALHLVALACAAVAAHCWLADRRPPPERLGPFYVWMAVGGAVGGGVVALAAPVVFDRVTEYPVAVALAGVVGIGALGARRPALTTALAVAAGVVTAVALRTFHGWVPAGQAVAAAVALGAGGAVLLRRPRLAAVALMPVVLWAAHDGRATLWRERTFFGVYRVTVNERGDHVLGVGTTTHGVQRRDAADRRRPMAYYHSTTPIGHWFFDHQADGPRHVGVVGLGIGSLAAYGRSGDRFDFYEIDPVVADLARDTSLFSHLADSPAGVEVVIGDGRRELAERAARYDLLLVDAFGSDAIPTHLLTVEAVRLYLERLTPDGTLALHLSNRSLDLIPTVARLADELGLAGFVAEGTPNAMELADGAFASTVAVLARDVEHLGAIASRSAWRSLAAEPLGSLWTDDRVDLLDALRLGG